MVRTCAEFLEIDAVRWSERIIWEPGSSSFPKAFVTWHIIRLVSRVGNADNNICARIANLHGDGPNHPMWTGWIGRRQNHLRSWNNRGYAFYQNDEMKSPFKWARRDDGRKYDHKSRRYRTPEPGVWSDVVRSDRKDGPELYTRDENGFEWVNPIEDNGRFNHGGPNPFALPLNTRYHDWHKQRYAVQKRAPLRW